MPETVYVIKVVEKHIGAPKLERASPKYSSIKVNFFISRNNIQERLNFILFCIQIYLYFLKRLYVSLCNSIFNSPVHVFLLMCEPNV